MTANLQPEIMTGAIYEPGFTTLASGQRTALTCDDTGALRVTGGGGGGGGAITAPLGPATAEAAAVAVVPIANTVTWTQRAVTLVAATSMPLIAANAARKALRWMNVGTNPMTVAPGAVTVVAGVGFNYDPGSSALNQGGADDFAANEMSTQAFSAISTDGTTVIVWEGA